MIDKKLKLIDENTSPLFRIMSIYNSDTPNKAFANNICAFHVGDGIIVSVAHNLKVFEPLPPFLSNSFFQNELSNKINTIDQPVFDAIYPHIPSTNYRQVTGIDKYDAEFLIKTLDDAKVDRRYIRLYTEKCCKPFLVTTFRNNAFCNDASLNSHFPAYHAFPEPLIKRYTFIIELELLDVFANEDLAIYRVVNTPPEIVNKLPFLDIDYKLYDVGTQDYYCLQSAPYESLGRIINEASIEGHLDNFAQETDAIGNIYCFDGLRYLIKGYFRFGSSGAPYLIYDKEQGIFKVNAVQSQASFIQLSIQNKMEGNRQYVNGIATPLLIVEEKIRGRLGEAGKKK